MSDTVKLIIEIPKEDYEFTKDAKTARYFPSEYYVKMILNGTPLPKGHGKIGDLDALRKEVSSWGMNDYDPSDFIDEIDRADVIIEADKAESEDKNDKDN